MFSIFMQSKTSIYQTNGIKIIKSKELPPVGIKPDTTKLWDFLCYTLVLHLSAWINLLSVNWGMDLFIIHLLFVH